jgi:hypothetical protein
MLRQTHSHTHIRVYTHITTDTDSLPGGPSFEQAYMLWVAPLEGISGMLGSIGDTVASVGEGFKQSSQQLLKQASLETSTHKML